MGSFEAMAGRCEVLMAVDDARLANQLLCNAAHEAWRVEAKFSRYRDDNVIHAINSSRGNPIEVDEETVQLLDFAERCYSLSDGAFDITSGVLRRVWRFDGSDRIPDDAAIQAVLPLVGWDKVDWRPPRLQLGEGMEIDLGGIAKEYAVDRTLALLREQTDTGLLINFGGDLHADIPGDKTASWSVGIESPDDPETPQAVITIRTGALASSGDARRFLIRDGVRYGHILDPRTGRPVIGAPRSVTVLGDNCTEAGLLATLALLQGEGASRFLRAQGVRHWCF